MDAKMEDVAEVPNAKKTFEIVGGNPVALWHYTGSDVNARCALCKLPNRYPCASCLVDAHDNGQCYAVKGRDCVHVFHSHCFKRRRSSYRYETLDYRIIVKQDCPYGCSKEFIKVEREDYDEEPGNNTKNEEGESLSESWEEVKKEYPYCDDAQAATDADNDDLSDDEDASNRFPRVGPFI